MEQAHLNFKTSLEGAAWIAKIAEEKGVSRTEVIRSALKVAAAHPTELNKIIDLRK